MSIDIDRIVNGTPSKRIINAYNTLKENYTEENALKYKEVYTNSQNHIMVLKYSLVC